MLLLLTWPAALNTHIHNSERITTALVLVALTTCNILSPLHNVLAVDVAWLCSSLSSNWANSTGNRSLLHTRSTLRCTPLRLVPRPAALCLQESGNQTTRIAQFPRITYCEEKCIRRDHVHIGKRSLRLKGMQKLAR